MVIDSSALVAMLTDEPEAARYEQAIEQDNVRLISSATMLETSIVIEARLADHGGRELDLLVHRARIAIIPFDEEQLVLARDAFRRYGRGRHAAALNFGDCFSYALSIARGEPLLFKGNDFAHTDVISALGT